VGVFLAAVPQVCRWRAAGLAISVVCLGLASGASSALATFPGTNGLIAYTGGSSIRTMLPNGRQDHPIAVGYDPSWSADGSRIVFARQDGGTEGQSEIYSMRANGGDVRRITASPGSEFAPAYGPAGKRVVFNVVNPRGEGPFIVSELATHARSHRQRLAVGRDPTFSPDGKHIAFSRSKTNEPNASIWMMRADGSHKRQLTQTGPKRDDVAPDFSPDGRWIAFTRFAWGGGMGEAVRRDGSGRHFLPCATYLPVYSPNARKIAYLGRGDNVFSIWSAQASGPCQETPLTGPFQSQAPGLSWQPLPKG
jgi:Tol biopolymer transport system component